MEREFIVLGPFDIPVKRYPSGRLIDSRTKAPLDSFWEDAEAVAKKKGLAGKIWLLCLCPSGRSWLHAMVCGADQERFWV